jgi:hypothetical protein
MRLPVGMRVMVTLLLLAGPTLGAAQTSVPPLATRPVAPSGPTVQGQEVEGSLRKVDRVARTITLDNGEEYFVPVGIVDLEGLQEGANVKLRYGVDGGRNFTTSLQIQR